MIYKYSTAFQSLCYSLIYFFSLPWKHPPVKALEVDQTILNFINTPPYDTDNDGGYLRIPASISISHCIPLRNSKIAA